MQSSKRGRTMGTDQAVSVDEQVQTWVAAGAYRPALTLLAETYHAPIYRYCLRMCQGQRALAEEVTQQVFEAACRGIAQFRAEASASCMPCRTSNATVSWSTRRPPPSRRMGTWPRPRCPRALCRRTMTWPGCGRLLPRRRWRPSIARSSGSVLACTGRRHSRWPRLPHSWASPGTWSTDASHTP